MVFAVVTHSILKFFGQYFEQDSLSSQKTLSMPNNSMNKFHSHLLKTMQKMGRHHRERTVTNLLSLKVKHYLFSAPCGQKTSPQNSGPCIFCHLHITSRKRQVVQIVTALRPWLIPGMSLSQCSNLRPIVVWTKDDLASRLFTIRDAQ